MGSDCVTGKCDAAHGVCHALTPHDTFADAEQNYFEVDLDCGGEECRKDGYTCYDGKFCAVDGDCTSGQCSGPAYLGCFVDSSTRAVGDGAVTFMSQTLTIAECATKCAGYNLFSLHYSRECFCGNSV